MQLKYFGMGAAASPALPDFTPPVEWWVAGLLFIFAVGFVVWRHYHRRSRRKEIERTRQCIARDLHDEVGSSLSSIVLTAELLQKELSANGLVSRQLARVHATAERLTHTLKEIVWAIDPEKDGFDDLLVRLRETAGELLAPRQIDYARHFPKATMP